MCYEFRPQIVYRGGEYYEEYFDGEHWDLREIDNSTSPSAIAYRIAEEKRLAESQKHTMDRMTPEQKRRIREVCCGEKDKHDCTTTATSSSERPLLHEEQSAPTKRDTVQELFNKYHKVHTASVVKDDKIEPVKRDRVQELFDERHNNRKGSGDTGGNSQIPSNSRAKDEKFTPEQMTRLRKVYDDWKKK